MAHANICMALQQIGDLKAESLDKAAAVLLFGYETPLPVVWEMGEQRGGRAETEQDNGCVSFTLLSSQNLSQEEDERKGESKCICADARGVAQSSPHVKILQCTPLNTPNSSKLFNYPTKSQWFCNSFVIKLLAYSSCTS